MQDLAGGFYSLAHSLILTHSYSHTHEGFKAPCIIDIKIGTETYEPNASFDKIEREKNKYQFQHEIGFRIVGFKVYDVITKTYKHIGKRFGRSLLPHKISEGLLLFFFNGLRYVIFTDLRLLIHSYSLTYLYVLTHGYLPMH